MKKNFTIIFVMLLGFISATVYHGRFSESASPPPAAGLANSADTPLVSLTFDDALDSTLDLAFPVLADANQKGVLYVPSGFVGKPGFLSWNEIRVLQDGGWEIGGHTVNHLELPKFTATKVRKELTQNSEHLKDQGLGSANFAAPYGAYSNITTAETAKVFNSQRAFHNIGYNRWPFNKYLLNVQYVRNTTTLEQAKQWVNEAVLNGSWLVLVFHDIVPSGESGDAYAWDTDKLMGLMEHLNSRGIKASRVDEVLNSFDNMLANSGFVSGLSGWQTDNKSVVRIDTVNKGSFPNPRDSVRFLGGIRAGHLFSQKVAVIPGKLYGLRAYIDSQQLLRGEFGFVVDEYNSDGNWVSWQWLGGLTEKNVMDYSYRYTPSSSDVAFSQVQVYMTARAVGSVYLDNLEFFAAK